MAADSQSIVALNIGSQRIGMAVFEPSKSGGVVLKAYDSTTILADPAMEMSRIPQVKVAVSELAQRLKVGKIKARYAISGQSVFIRFVKLPPLGEENIEQIVTFEAQQHVPFPINEVVWDYQLLEGGEEKEVTLVAIKSDALDEINDAVNEAGVGTAEIDAAPMALYNAMRRAVADLSEPTLLIDIGAKTTNLLYVEGSKFFTRSVAVGGVSLTTAIEKEYGISFADAEAQKVTNGLVALGGGHTEQLDEAVAALAMTLRNALSRLPSEIARTTNYYRSQHGGSAPKRVLLAGGGANLPYLKEFFEEKMRLPVEFFNPLSAVAVAKGVDVDRLQREAHMMGELVGLGLRGVGKAAVNIDLVPATVEEERASERRRPYLIATAAALILGAAVFGFYKNSAAKKADGLVKEIEGQVENLVQFEAPLKKLNNEEQNLRNLADGYVGADRSHAYWVDLLGELKEGMASDALWVVDLEPLVGYDPLAKRDANGRLKLSKVVRDEFQKAPFGTSSLLKISKPRVAQENGRPHRGRQAEPKLPEINAVLIRGLWRKNADDAKVVNKALEKMRENAHSFRFVVTDPKSGEVELSDEQIITSNTTTSEHGEFALPFEMIIPLAKSVPFK
jgi:type IV pilus assembly protein PilM